MPRLAAALTLLVCGPLQAAETPVLTEADEYELTEVIITAREPRYAAPTTRDRIGRVWIPVHMDGKGPYRLVLDTGALRSAVTDDMVRKMGEVPDLRQRVMLHGATGSAIMPTISVESMRVGDLDLRPERMPVVGDVFGGAEGLLGVEGMQQHRILIDFRHDYVEVARSKNRRAAAGFSSVRFLQNDANLLIVPVIIGEREVRAIIDTGAQATVGNNALRRLLRRQFDRNAGIDKVYGTTGDVQEAMGLRLNEIRIGDLRVTDPYITFGDLHIFDRWDMVDKPMLLIGMDLLGLVDSLVIDYRRRELQIKPRIRG
jgi:predicted aspartyl protease